ncbi:MAG: hypothetical protein V1882_02210 [Candidatus Omnitrophota bacterium]
MGAKTIVLLGCFLLSAISPAWCEDTAGGTCAFTAKSKSSGVTTEQPDPYKDVTWSSVTQKNQNQDQTVTVYTPQGTGQADFVSVSSTGTGTPASAIVATPQQTRRAKRWFFW